MKNVLNENVEKIRRSRRDYRKYLAIFAVLAVVTILGVNWGLHQNGISMTADYVCGKEEHTHSTDCYTSVLICGQEESEGSAGHTHTDACYEEQSVLTCTNTDAEHVHTDGCYTTERVLICGQEESEGSAGHTHTDACYEKQLTCGKEEHTHTVACMSDESADVETASDWEKTIPSGLSGVWADDLVAVAQSQIGYTESTKNFQIAEDGETRQGYTRYGDWYGNKYGDWCAMFASFCLNYAGISDEYVPYNSGCTAWVAALDEEGLYEVREETASYGDPKPGDLIFFDNKGDDGKADHVGIVEEVTTDDDGNVTKIKTIEGNSSDKVAERTYDADDSAILGYAILPENPEITGTVETMSEDDGINAAANDSTGVDLGKYITSVNFQKKNGVVWETSEEFTTDDQVRGTINFEKVYTSTLKANSNTIYIDLPKYIDCSRFTGTYDTYDGGTHSGQYRYEKNEDGTYRIVLVLDDDYVAKAGDTIGGSLQFSFEWDNIPKEDEGKLPIEIGDWTGEVTVKDNESGGDDKGTANYWINKTSGTPYYSEDGKTIYVDYTIKLEVKNEMTAPINMKDTLSNANFTYDSSSLLVTGGDVKANFGSTQGQGSSTQIQLWPIGNSSKIPVGTYYITYRVKSNNIDASDPDAFKDGVNNKVVVPEEGDNQANSETWTTFTEGKINKQGQLVSGSDGSYIDYTVYLNAGDIIKNLKTGATFTDTIPDAVTLQGDVTVEQYDVTGKLVKTETVTVSDGKNISYTTPTGQYYYIIKYRTKVNVASNKIPLGGMTVKNDGKSTGGIDGSSSSEVVIPKHVLHKNYVSQKLEKDKDGKWTNTMKWTSTIEVSDSLKGYVYEDWSGLNYISGYNYNVVSMSDAQRAAIVVTDANGNTVDSSKYTIEKSSHTTQTWDPDTSAHVSVSNGLFKITFTDDVTGPVTISYETTADLSRYAVGAQINFVNYASLTKDGHTDTDQAQTPTIQYQTDNKSVIYKWGGVIGARPEGSVNSGTVILQPGQTSIPWTIAVNEGQKLYSDIVVTDIIPEGLKFLPESLDINLNGNSTTQQIKNSDGVTWNYDEATRKLTVTIKASVYSGKYAGMDTGYSQQIFIAYRTELPESFIKGSDVSAEYKNTASATIDGEVTDSTYDNKVERQVVGKNGSYDKEQGILSYEIVINPDEATLNKGESLKIEDILSTYYADKAAILDYITLDSLELFTAATSTDSSGNVSVKAGRKLQDLVQVSSHPADFQYMYDNTTKSFATYLPDSTAYVIVAKYKVDGDVTEDIQLKNVVKLTGQNSWSKEDTSTKVTQNTSGETHTDKDKLTVVKHDKALYSTVLSGATFKLEKYADSSWTTVSSQTTSDNGKATWEDISYNTLHKLTETAAPSGYVIDSTPTYVMIVRNKDASNAQSYLPDSIAGESGYSKDAVKIYTVKDNTYDDNGKVKEEYFANVEIDRYDTQDTTKVEPGQLRVNKVWVDSQGKTITDAADLAKMSDVSVTLTKHVAKTGNTVTVTHNNNSGTLTVNNGGYIVFKGITTNKFSNGNFNVSSGYTWSCTDANVSIQSYTLESDNTYTITVGPFNQDCTITSDPLYWDSVYYGKATAQGGTAPEGTNDTVIGIVTLNSANDWTYLWSNLERTEGVTYTLTETTVEGYTTTYKINSEDLEPNTPFTPSTSGDKITVTNTADRTYKLPDSGGIGTKVFTAGGLAIIAAGLMYGYSLRRRRESREE